jgi:Ca2+-binding RTX toxin-like protein
LDTKTGGAGDDTVSALPTTLTVGDTFDGGAGSDTVSLTASLAADTAVAGFTLKNIENLAVNITDADTANAETLTLNLASTDSEKVTLSGLGATTKSDTLVLNNVAAGTTIAMNSATDLNVTANFVAAATAGTTAKGTPDTVSVSVAGNATTDITQDSTITIGSGFEIMTLDSSTSASKIDQVTFGGATLNVTGDANLTIDAGLDASLYVINAADFTGKLNIATTVNANPDVLSGSVDIHDVTITGGSGNDTIDTTANVANNEISVNGGAGDDTITIGQVPSAATTTNAGDQIDGGEGTDVLTSASATFNSMTAAGNVGVTNFETVAMDALAHTLTIANIQATGISTVSITGGTGGLIMPAGAMTVAISASLTGALALTDTGTAVTDSVTLVNTATAATDMGAGNDLTVTGYETVNIVTTAVSDTSQDFGTISVTGDANADATASTTTLNFLGSDRASVGAITATTINASGLAAAGTGTTFNMTAAATSVTTITGSEGADTLRGDAKSTINGGGGKDTIIGGTGNDTLNGGDGADSITTSTGSDTVDGGAGNDTIVVAGNLTSADKINGGDGTDILSVTNASLVALQSLTISEANTFNTNFTNMETLLITDGMDTTGDSFDLGYLSGITTVAVTTLATDAETIAGFTSGSTLSLSAALGFGLTASVSGATAGATDELTVALTANADTDYGDLTIANIETLNVNATQSTAAAATSVTNTVGFSLSQTAVAASGSGAAQTVNFSGSEDITVDTAVAVATISAAGMGARLAATPGLVMSTLATATTAMPGQSVTGSGGADTLFGSTGADTISGGAGNDILVGGAGADTLDGGTGSDTYSTAGMVGANIGGTGTGTSTGVVVNLGSAALSNVAIINASTQFISTAITSVASGTAAYLFGAAANTNSVAVDTLSNIDNITLAGNGINYVVGNANTITGGSGADTISAGAGADVITGGAGIDTLTGGTGVDTFVFDTVVLAANANNITDFDQSAGDVLRFDAVTFTGYTAAAVTVIDNTAAAALVAGAVAGSADQNVIVATAAQIGALDFATGAVASGALIAVASDTGDIYYDADGDFTALSVVIGSITAAEAAALAAGNITIV